MKKLILNLVAFVFAALTLSTVALANETSPSQQMPEYNSSMIYSQPAVELRNSMRKLWEDHITWTHVYIVSSLADLPDSGAIANRLLKNQEDIGNAIKPYYGNDAAMELTKLLKSHIIIATKVVSAAKSGKSNDLAIAQQVWKSNADQIASFLSGANENWSHNELTKMLYGHLALNTDQVVARLKKDWAGDIASYDKGHSHILMFADMLSNGIIDQFPDKF